MSQPSPVKEHQVSDQIPAAVIFKYSKFTSPSEDVIQITSSGGISGKTSGETSHITSSGGFLICVIVFILCNVETLVDKKCHNVSCFML